MNTKPAVFFSYTRVDDKREEGKLSQIRKALEAELCTLSGDDWIVFQDIEHIEIGEQWAKRLAEGVSASTFFLPILTPTYLKRPVCRNELAQFLDRERKLERDDLIFPVLYVDTPILTVKNLRESDELAVALATRNWADWRELRDYKVKTTKVRRTIRNLAEAILAAGSRAHGPLSSLATPSEVRPSAVTMSLPPLSAQWQDRVHSAVTIAWKIIPFTAMMSRWLHEVAVRGLPSPESLNYPVLKFGPKATDLIEELYGSIRAQPYPIYMIPRIPAPESFETELRNLEAAELLEGGRSVTADFARGLRLNNAGFIIDLALLCDDPRKSNTLNEIIETTKKSLDGRKLSDFVGLHLIVINAFFGQYVRRGQGSPSMAIGASMYIPKNMA